jgi:hippurate hydrolase
MFKSSNSLLFPVSSQLREWIRDIRRHIHAHPELSFLELETAGYIREKLREIGIDGEIGIAGTGIVAGLAGGPPERRQGVALRADMDALPVVEETGLAFSSKNSGVMHACGHDGHVAMLLGAAALLAGKELPGPVTLLFQPAEEHGNGAQHCVEAGVLDNIGAIFAGHIDTHYSTGTLTVDEGIVCAWADPFRIRLRGKSGHAARPHEAVDPVVAAANLILAVQTLISRGVDPNRAAVITIGSIQAGSAQNIIAREALLMGTIRSTDCRTRKTTVEGLIRVVEAIGGMHLVETSLEFHDAIPAVENDRKCAEIARIAATLTEGVIAAVSQGASSLGAEDFACYQQKIPGCMVRFGASLGENAGVAHSGTFDFDEDVLAIGASWYANAAWHWLCDRYGQNAS